MSQAKINTHFAHILFSCLKDLGVETVFMAPGSRSSPLSLAAHHYARNFYTHFDERSLGFMAVGHIKKEGQPVAIITTSGTAVGNLMPSVMEASVQSYPLIVITADRPKEYQGVGAQQTLNQVSLFGSYVRFEINCEAPDVCFNERALTTQLSYALSLQHKGPIHINIPLHEPLFDQSVDFPHDVAFRKEYRELKQLELKKKGLIILGEGSTYTQEEADFFEALSLRLDYPIVADISSGYRSFGKVSLFYYPFYIETLSFDTLVHFGTKLTSKGLENFIKKHTGNYIHFDKNSTLYDPYHKIGSTYRGDISLWKGLLEYPQNIANECARFYGLNSPLKNLIAELIETHPSFEEAMYIDLLNKEPPLEGQLFCGTSLPIRHFECFFFPEKATAPTYTQRGVSGIDGLIATSAGLASDGTLTLAFLGDLSTLYDLNALCLITQNNLPLIPVIFNNHGGGIFSHLPIAHQTKHFDEVIATSHSFNFKGIAGAFDLDYVHISSLNEFAGWLKKPTPYTLIEIVSTQQGNPKFHDRIKNSVCSFVKNSLEAPLRSYSSTDCLAPQTMEPS